MKNVMIAVLLLLGLHLNGQGINPLTKDFAREVALALEGTITKEYVSDKTDLVLIELPEYIGYTLVKFTLEWTIINKDRANRSYMTAWEKEDEQTNRVIIKIDGRMFGIYHNRINSSIMLLSS